MADAHATRRYYERPEEQTEYRASPDPGAATPRPTPTVPDVHARVASMGSTPALLRRLGLAVDLRLADADRATLAGATWVAARFVPAPEADVTRVAPPRTLVSVAGDRFDAVASDEWVAGALPLADPGYVLLDLDPDASGLKLDQHLRGLPRAAATEVNGDPASSAPGTLRTAGFARRPQRPRRGHPRADSQGRVDVRTRRRPRRARPGGDLRRPRARPAARGLGRPARGPGTACTSGSSPSSRIPAPGSSRCSPRRRTSGFLQLSGLNRVPGSRREPLLPARGGRRLGRVEPVGAPAGADHRPRPRRRGAGRSRARRPPGHRGADPHAGAPGVAAPAALGHVLRLPARRRRPRRWRGGPAGRPRSGRAAVARCRGCRRCSPAGPRAGVCRPRPQQPPHRGAGAGARRPANGRRPAPGGCRRRRGRSRVGRLRLGRRRDRRPSRIPPTGCVTGDERVDGHLDALWSQAVADVPPPTDAQVALAQVAQANATLLRAYDTWRVRPQLQADPALFARAAGGPGAPDAPEARVVTAPRPYLRWAPVPPPTLVAPHPAQHGGAALAARRAQRRRRRVARRRQRVGPARRAAEDDPARRRDRRPLRPRHRVDRRRAAAGRVRRGPGRARDAARRGDPEPRRRHRDAHPARHAARFSRRRRPGRRRHPRGHHRPPGHPARGGTVRRPRHRRPRPALPPRPPRRRGGARLLRRRGAPHPGRAAGAAGGGPAVPRRLAPGGAPAARAAHRRRAGRRARRAGGRRHRAAGRAGAGGDVVVAAHRGPHPVRAVALAPGERGSGRRRGRAAPGPAHRPRGAHARGRRRLAVVAHPLGRPAPRARHPRAGPGARAAPPRLSAAGARPHGRRADRPRRPARRQHRPARRHRRLAGVGGRRRGAGPGAGGPAGRRRQQHRRGVGARRAALAHRPPAVRRRPDDDRARRRRRGAAPVDRDLPRHPPAPAHLHPERGDPLRRAVRRGRPARAAVGCRVGRPGRGRGPERGATGRPRPRRRRAPHPLGGVDRARPAVRGAPGAPLGGPDLDASAVVLLRRRRAARAWCWPARPEGRTRA